MAATSGKTAFKYAAYICYSHSDDVIAAWLHRRLERDNIPGIDSLLSKNQNDPLLQAEWPDASSDVCEGVTSVSPLNKAN